MSAPLACLYLHAGHALQRKRREFAVDKGTLSGIGIALGGIAVGLYLDGGQVAQLLQPTAALIVFGGTLGAVMVQFPFAVVKQAFAQLMAVFSGRKDPAQQLVGDLTNFAVRARRNGLMSLDAD